MRTITRKSYPFVKWLLAGSGVLLAIGLLMSGLLDARPDAPLADRTLFLLFLGAAVLLPFLALLFPRREVFEALLPTDRLHEASRTELQGILAQLEAAHEKGDIPDERYQRAKAKVLAEMAGPRKA